MSNGQIAISDQHQIQIHVSSKLMHVTAYRLWVKQPGTDWVQVGDGHTGDDLPDTCTFGPVSKGTRLAYWYGIVSAEANANYSVLLTLSQNGNVLPDGECRETGKTNGESVARAEGEVELT